MSVETVEKVAIAAHTLRGYARPSEERDSRRSADAKWRAGKAENASGRGLTRGDVDEERRTCGDYGVTSSKIEIDRERGESRETDITKGRPRFARKRERGTETETRSSEKRRTMQVVK